MFHVKRRFCFRRCLTSASFKELGMAPSVKEVYNTPAILLTRSPLGAFMSQEGQGVNYASNRIQLHKNPISSLKCI